MERYYSNPNYNQLKIRQYEEYIRRQNYYYIYMKIHYEKYIKNQSSQYINMKRYYEEYIKRQNNQYINMRKYYEEYIKKQSRYYLYLKKYYEENNVKNKDSFENKIKEDKINTQEDKLINSLNNVSIEDNQIKDNLPDNHINDFFENDIVVNNSKVKEDKKEKCEYLNNSNNSNNTSIEEAGQYDYLINKSSTSSKDSKKEEFLEDYNILFANFPVILAEVSIEVPVEDTITLEQEVIEIKEIKKNLFLTKYNLIPFSASIIEPNSGVLFIEGFIRKNIEYAVPIYNDGEKINRNGNVKQCIVEIPFKVTTRVNFLKQPIFNENINEKPYVEIVKVTFIQIGINKNLILSKEANSEKILTEMTEKTILNVVLKVLQKQQVKVAIENKK
ncbi:DUF7852 domain-containing protein [Clostridium nigeriense]|uniref:DUF7852 domain-containing protein n=1 Tax=Clostridium nigeriense TaxID=1805470 RepID=UPI0008378CD1|nr:hypothetical protein [Clostridium nigeriense]